MKTTSVLFFLVLVSFTACGGGDPPANRFDATPSVCNGAAPLADRYFPLQVGGVWKFKVTDTMLSSVSDKTQTIEAEEDVGGEKAGVTAFRLRTEKPGGDTVSWQELQDCKVVRHREQKFDPVDVMTLERFYEPGKLRVDESTERLKTGANWTETYTQKETEAGATTSSVVTLEWTVVAESESVTVPAGTFTALRIQREDKADMSTKSYWFAPGVGKVKEDGQIVEELTECTGLPGC